VEAGTHARDLHRQRGGPLPPFLRNTGKGWVDAPEYADAAARYLAQDAAWKHRREKVRRPRNAGNSTADWPSLALGDEAGGRTLGEGTIGLDLADVIKPTAETRTESITGAFVAMVVRLPAHADKDMLRS